MLSLSPAARGRLLAILAPCFWSISGVVIRNMEGATEWQINFYRSGSLAVFVLVVLGVWYRTRLIQVLRAGGILAVIAGGFISIAYVGNIVALKHTTVANAMIMMAIAPIIAAVAARIFLAERLTDATTVAIVLALLGIAIMVGGGLSAGALYGDLVALFTVAFFGGYAVILRRASSVDMTPAVLYSGVIAAIVGGSVALATGDGLVVSQRDLTLCVLLGVVQIGVGGLLFAVAARTVPAAQLTLIALAEPVLSPLWTWIGVGEVPAYATFIGGAIILAAVVIQATDRRVG